MSNSNDIPAFAANDLNRWDHEMEDWLKEGPLQEIADIKKQLFEFIFKKQLKPPDKILLHYDGSNAPSGPYRSWYGKTRFTPPECLQRVRGWLAQCDTFKFAVLLDGDIAKYTDEPVPIRGSNKSMEYFQILNLFDKKHSSTQLKYIMWALDSLFERMQHENE